MEKHFSPPKRNRFNQVNLSMSTKQIIIGSLLGDGSLKIAKGYANARYSEHHSVVQEDYLRWKYNQLYVELKGTLSITKPDKSSYSRLGKIIYQSGVSTELTSLHHLTHEKNQKVIKRNWLNNLEALGLAMWWCDDGSLNVVTRQGVLCTDGFTYKENLICARYLEVSWGIKCKTIPNPVKNKNKELIRIDYRLRFSTLEDLKQFLRIILPYIPVASMLYKVMICYKDPKNQERWISEVKELLPKFAGEIETEYEKPFCKYQHLVNKKSGLTFRDIFYKTAKWSKYISENDIVQ